MLFILNLVSDHRPDSIHLSMLTENFDITLLWKVLALVAFNSEMLHAEAWNTLTHREFFLKSYEIKPKSDCSYHFPIDLEPNGRPFGSKSIVK